MEKKAMNSRMNGVNEKGVETEARFSLGEELQIIKSIQQGGKERDTAIEKLTQSRLRFVAAVAKKYANNTLSYPPNSIGDEFKTATFIKIFSS